jgi:hypothetical protein
MWQPSSAGSNSYSGQYSRLSRGRPGINSPIRRILFWQARALSDCDLLSCLVEWPRGGAELAAAAAGFVHMVF